MEVHAVVCSDVCTDNQIDLNAVASADKCSLCLFASLANHVSKKLVPLHPLAIIIAKRCV